MAKRGRSEIWECRTAKRSAFLGARLFGRTALPPHVPPPALPCQHLQRESWECRGFCEHSSSLIHAGLGVCGQPGSRPATPLKSPRRWSALAAAHLLPCGTIHSHVGRLVLSGSVTGQTIPLQPPSSASPSPGAPVLLLRRPPPPPAPPQPLSPLLEPSRPPSPPSAQASFSMARTFFVGKTQVAAHAIARRDLPYLTL